MYLPSRSTKPRRVGIEASRKMCCILSGQASPLPWHTAEQLGENSYSTCIQHFGLFWGCLRDWLLSHLTQNVDKNGSILWMPGWGSCEQTQISWVVTAPEILLY